MCVSERPDGVVRRSSIKNSRKFGFVFATACILGLGVAACSDSNDDPETTPECSSTDPCPTGQFCNAHNVCEHEQGGECSDEAPCPSGQFCNDSNTCENETGGECSTSAPCPTGQICNNDGICETDPGQTASGARLNDVVSEAPGVNCPYGGQALRTGIDANDNGELESSEVDGVSYVCTPVASNGPGFLLDTEILNAGDADCQDGGVIIHSGYDNNENGELDTDERQSSVTQCNSDACDNTDPLSIQIVQIEEDPFGSYDASATYEVRVQLNRDVDASTLQVVQYNEAFAPDADFTWSVDSNNPSVVLVDFQPTNYNTTQLTIADDCSIATQSVELRNGINSPLNVRAHTDDVPVVGEDIEVCWESRNATSCTVNKGTSQAPDEVPLPDLEQGCMNVEVLADQIFNNSYYTGPAFTCVNGGGGIHSYTVAMYLNTGIHMFSVAGSNSGPSNGGVFSFQTNTIGMESCELVINDTRYDFPTNTPNSPVYLTEGGQVMLECVDGNDDTHTRGDDDLTLVAVGPGLTYANASMGNNADDNVALTLSLEGVHILDGSCTGTFTYGTESKEIPEQTWDAYSAPDDYMGTIYLTEDYDDLPYDATTEASVELTCTDGDFSQTVTKKL